MDELFALPPEQFTAARDAAARSAPDRASAAALRALRRPQVAAWVLNRLARAEPDLLEQLLSLGPQLAAAQAAGSGGPLRRLAEQRRALLSTVAARAVQLAGRELPASVREQVAQTLQAALADALAAQAVRSGRLVRPLTYAGLGPVDLTDAVGPAGAVADRGADRAADRGADRGAGAVGGREVGGVPGGKGGGEGGGAAGGVPGRPDGPARVTAQGRPGRDAKSRLPPGAAAADPVNARDLQRTTLAAGGALDDAVAALRAAERAADAAVEAAARAHRQQGAAQLAVAQAEREAATAAEALRRALALAQEQAAGLDAAGRLVRAADRQAGQAQRARVQAERRVAQAQLVARAAQAALDAARRS